MKAVRTAVQIVGAIATIVAMIPSPIQPIAAAVAAVAAVANTALAATAPSPSRAGSPLEFRSDPQAGIPYLIGRTAYAGNIVHRDTWGSDNKYQGFAIIWGGGGPYEQLESFSADLTNVAFAAGGAALGSSWGTGDNSPWMWLKTQTGLCPSPVITSPVAGFPGWGASSKMSGYAGGVWVVKFDKKGKKFTNGVPSPLAIWKAAKVYDPRLDSTYPGGAGACRALDESTYVWSENPYLHGITWALGRWQNGKRVMGIGQAVTTIDMPAWVDAANIADANAWKVGGMVTSLDEKWNVLKQMCQAGGGEPMRLGAKLSVMVSAPKVSVITIETADLIGTGTVTATQSRRERINSIIPRVRLESHGWQVVPLDVVTSATYVVEDGGTRTRELDLHMVQWKDQGAELAAYAIVNAREFGPISLPLRIRFIGVKPGDCVTVNIPELGLTAQPCIVTQRALDPESAAVTLDLKSETPAKHAFALGRTATAPPTPDLVPDDPSIVAAPIGGSWAVIAFPLVGTGGTTPALLVTGTTADQAGAEQVVFESRVTGTADWHAVSTEPAATTAKFITDVAPGESYDVAVSYVVAGVVGDRLMLGPVIAPDAVASTFTDAGDLSTLDSIYFGDGYLLEAAGGAAATLGNFRTNLGTSAAFAGQGALATLSQVNIGAAGRVYSDDGATRLTDALAVTSLGTAAAFAGQGALATLSQVSLGAGGRVYRDDGATHLTDTLAVTSLGTAAAIAGQGAFATQSSVAYGSSYLTGFGALAPLGQVNIGAAGRVYRDDGTTRLTDALAVTSLGTAAAFTGQGALATLSLVSLGSGGRVYRDDGTTHLTDAIAITSLGTAAAFVGQAAWATYTGPINDVVRPGSNLLFNGSLKFGLQGWSTFGAGNTVNSKLEYGSNGPSTIYDRYIYSDRFSVGVGDTLTLSAELFSHLTSGHAVYISWLDGTLTQITTSGSLAAGTADAWQRLQVSGVAPAGTVYASVLIIPGTTSAGGYFQVRKLKVENGAPTVAVFSDEATNGAMYRTGVTIDSLKPAQVGADVTASQPIVQYLSPTTGRATTQLLLATAGFVGVKNTNSVALTAADVGTTATITVPSHVRKVPGASGAETRTYNSGTITGRAFATTYFIYCDDPGFLGGAVTYVATTNSDDLAGAIGRVFVGSVTTPADGAGGTSGGGGGIGGGGGGGGVIP